MSAAKIGFDDWCERTLMPGLLAAAVVLLPFDELPYLHQLHGFALGASNYPLAILIVLWFWAVLRGRARWPRGAPQSANARPSLGCFRRRSFLPHSPFTTGTSTTSAA